MYISHFNQLYSRADYLTLVKIPVKLTSFPLVKLISEHTAQLTVIM